jgi:hypothetical protein
MGVSDYSQRGAFLRVPPAINGFKDISKRPTSSNRRVRVCSHFLLTPRAGDFGGVPRARPHLDCPHFLQVHSCRAVDFFLRLGFRWQLLTRHLFLENCALTFSSTESPGTEVPLATQKQTEPTERTYCLPAISPLTPGPGVGSFPADSLRRQKNEQIADGRRDGEAALSCAFQEG